MFLHGCSDHQDQLFSLFKSKTSLCFRIESRLEKIFWMGCINNSLSLARKKRGRIFVHGHISRGRLRSEQVMSKNEYPSLFLRQTEVIVFFIIQIFLATHAAFNIGEFPSAWLVT